MGAAIFMGLLLGRWGTVLHKESTGCGDGFLSVGGGSQPYGARRGHGGAPPARKIKLLMLGDSGVGKSSLMDRFMEDYFSITKVQTLGVDFKLKTIVLNDEEVDLQVWDTAGQQKFHKITQAYYRGSHGIVLVYDMSDPKTLDNTAYWMRSIRDTAGSNRVQICLVGNKVDLREEVGLEGQQQDLAGMVETSTGRKVAEEFGAEYFECSAKTGCMVEEAFIATATKAYEAHLVKPSTPSTRIRRRLGRKKHRRTASQGSDRDRPPRSDASGPAAATAAAATFSPSFASVPGVVESGAERPPPPDSPAARMRACASEVSETGTAVGAAGQASVMASSSSHSHNVSAGGTGQQQQQQQQRFMSSSSYGGVATTPYSAPCSPPSPAPCGRPRASAAVTTPPQGGGGGGSQSPRQEQPEPPQQPMMPSADVKDEQQQQQQQQQHEIGELVPPLSALSPKTAAAALGMAGGKGAPSGAAGEDSPTGTGTMSPLPGHQRSIGRSSSLGDMESYFGTSLGSPNGSDIDSSADGGGGGSSGVPRRRADTGGLFGLFSGGGGGGGKDVRERGGGFSCCSPKQDAGAGACEHPYRRRVDGSGSLAVAEIIARQRQRSPRPTAGPGPWGDDPPPPAVSRMKGKKPPRVPRMKRMSSSDLADGVGVGGARGKAGKNVCKVS
ncbi:Rab8E, RAB family GTPase [Ectocarpus siliculosus]|uniref:Rab8E, RAB family GTPase n=1 Tax=Ectocarpus siliculosus TaxID=2880 RepID=D8LMQ2_ECTSI|nr:Rab8E, RAB family GTPase [Ectocarpus siliculosus]|eukprot:CBN76228.1 Rab8E, RAB family GTPase [Ectocarpus siliculosus]